MDLRTFAASIDMAAMAFLRAALTDPEYADLVRATARKLIDYERSNDGEPVIDRPLMVMVMADDTWSTAFSALNGKTFTLADGGTASLRFEAEDSGAEHAALTDGSVGLTRAVVMVGKGAAGRASLRRPVLS
jgi:hypothetical protein